MGGVLLNIVPLPKCEVPKEVGRIFDVSIDPLVRLRSVESGEFEDIVCQWATGYLTQIEGYKNVAQIGGSKDSGRDIVAYLDESLQKFDIFQCKRYKDPLTPSVYMSEFGKLCYYTMNGRYNIPRKYFIVASNGIGQDLRELVEHPQNINKQLVLTWNKYCGPKKKIIAEGIPLTKELKKYIDLFDFSIVSEISPQTLLEQFAKTGWYKYHFGGGLKKRQRVEMTSEILEDEEKGMNYVSQLLKVYSKHENTTINDVDSLKSKKKMHDHFKRQRECFHNAHSLMRFTRDELMNDEVYKNLKHQVYHGVIEVCESDHCDDLERVNQTIARSQLLPIKTEDLGDINILEKSGMCHDLVNDGKMDWSVEEDERKDI